MATYRVAVPMIVYGEEDCRRLARHYENNGDHEAAQHLTNAAQAIKDGTLKPFSPREPNIYLFGGGRNP